MSFLNARETIKSNGSQLVAWTELNQIQARILAAVGKNQNSVLIDSGTLVTKLSGSIDDIVIIDSGSGYATKTASISVTNTSGSGAVIEPYVDKDTGAITDVSVIHGGSGYFPVQASAVAHAGNANAAFLVYVAPDGSISAVHVIASGTGYVQGDVISIVHPTGTGADVVVGSVGTGGEILTTIVNNGGTGYSTVLPSITVSHVTGSGFSATPVINNNGVLTDVVITNKGSGYQPHSATIEIESVYGRNAEIEPLFDIQGRLVSVDVVNPGSGYSTTDLISVIASEYQTVTREAVLKISTDNNSIDAPTAIEYYNSYYGLSTNTNLKTQLEWIRTQLALDGYNAKIQTNSDTQNTLAWLINW